MSATILTRPTFNARGSFADTVPAVHRTPLRQAAVWPVGDRPPEPDAGHGDPGFRLGWEHARHGVLPPTEHLLPMSPVRQGWESGRRAFAGRTRVADVAVHQWLQLNQRAWLDGAGIDAVQVAPAFLRRIATGACPVTREDFGKVQPAPMAVWHEAGCVAGNLALLSPRAARVLARVDARSAIAQADSMAGDDVHAGLTTREWARLATLLSFVTPLPHGLVAGRAMPLLPPPRLRLLNPAQGLQCLIGLQAPGAGQARRDGLLAALMPHAEARYALADLQSTMLARRKAPARAGDLRAQREAIEDLWADGLVHRRWQRLVSRLSEADCESIVRVAVARGAAGDRVQWLPATAATDGWGSGAACA